MDVSLSESKLARAASRGRVLPSSHGDWTQTKKLEELPWQGRGKTQSRERDEKTKLFPEQEMGHGFTNVLRCRKSLVEARQVTLRDPESEEAGSEALLQTSSA